MSCNFVSFHETLNQPYFSRRLTLCVTEWRPFCDQSNALEVMVWLLVLQEPPKKEITIASFQFWTIPSFYLSRAPCGAIKNWGTIAQGAKLCIKCSAFSSCHSLWIGLVNPQCFHSNSPTERLNHFVKHCQSIMNSLL